MFSNYFINASNPINTSNMTGTENIDAFQKLCAATGIKVFAELSG